MKTRDYTFHRRLFLALILCLAGVGVCLAGKGNKAIQKECKKMSKQLTKEGWKVEGRAVSLEEALINYYEELEKSGSDAQSLVGNGRARSENQARTMARTNASAEYSRMMESQIRSEQEIKVTNKTEGGDTNSSVDFTNTTQAQSQQNVKNLKPRLTISRKLADGMTEMRMYFIVNF